MHDIHLWRLQLNRKVQHKLANHHLLSSTPNKHTPQTTTHSFVRPSVRPFACWIVIISPLGLGSISTPEHIQQVLFQVAGPSTKTMMSFASHHSFFLHFLDCFAFVYLCAREKDPSRAIFSCVCTNQPEKKKTNWSKSRIEKKTRRITHNAVYKHTWQTFPFPFYFILLYIFFSFVHSFFHFVHFDSASIFRLVAITISLPH